MRAVRLPKARPYVVVPTSDRESARAGLLMLDPSRHRTLLIQKPLVLGGDVVGPRVVPGPRFDWRPEPPADQWQALMAAWQEVVGPVRGVAAYERPQAQREGFVLTLVGDVGVLAVVKVRRDYRELKHEGGRHGKLLARLDKVRLPSLLASGRGTEYSWMMLTPIIAGPRPFLPADLVRFSDGISRMLVPVLGERPSEVPDDWQPAHGDLTRWNLRYERRGLSLIDWESACYVPRFADEVLFSAMCARDGFRTAAWQRRHDEAREYWVSRIIEEGRQHEKKER